MKKKLFIILTTITICSNNFSSDPAENDPAENSPKKINHYFYTKRKKAKEVEELKSCRANRKNNISLEEEKSKSGSLPFLSNNGSYKK
jgi:hypothetical protein